MQNLISTSYFKAHCLKILNNVSNRKDTIIVTKRGKAVAKIQPIEPLDAQELLFNSLSNKATINADILEAEHETWDAENE